MRHVPTSIKVVSILGIIYAAIWLLFLPCGLILQFHPLTHDPTMDALNKDTAYMVNYVVSFVLWTLLMALLLAGSIGSLKLKPWARKWMLAFAWIHIAFAVLNIVVSLVLVMPRMETVYAANPTMAAMLPMIKIASIVMVFVVAAMYGVISGVILYFYTRPVAVDAFNGIFPAMPSNFPVEMPQDSVPP